MNKKIGIFGGTFDPIHIGHISLAKDAVEQAKLDKVIFVPSKLQPFKLGEKITDVRTRAEMISFAMENPKFSYSTWEMEQEGISYTYLTLEHFKKMSKKDEEIHFICGTDVFLKIKTWKKGEKVLRENKFIVGSRPGYKDKELDEEIVYLRKNFGTEIQKIYNQPIDVSSTEIRENINKHEKYLKENVKRYIANNGLYK